MKKQTLIPHLIMGGYQLLIVLCVLAIITCNSACFVHRHQQSQTAKADTVATHTETEISTWAMDSADKKENHSYTETSVEIEFDSSGGSISSTGSHTKAEDYFPDYVGRIKLLKIKSILSSTSTDSGGKSAVATNNKAACDSAAAHSAVTANVKNRDSFDTTLLWIIAAMVASFLLYRYRSRISGWLLRNGFVL